MISEEHKRFQKIYVLNETHVSRMNYPAKRFIIIASSTETLKIALQNIKNSIWWNHDALFLIIGNDCANISLALYLCQNTNGQFVLYTFNPYTNMAPKFWNIVRADLLPEESWTLFEHPVASISEFLSTP